jgi:hypothetical protein
MTKVFSSPDLRYPLVSFVIPVRDDAGRLEVCLSSIAQNEYPADAIEVVVVDNGSADASREVAASTGATVIERPGVSVAELRNMGARAVRGAFVAFVDADHAIDRQWVRQAVAAFTDLNIAAVGALCHAPAGGPWVQRAYDRLRARRSGCRDVEWLGSGNLVVRRDVFDAVGGFDATLETCEDVDLCQRIRALGFTVRNDDRLINVHFGDPESLGAVFRGELWRGRDNLRVSLRRPISWRGLPSTAIPIMNLALVAVAAAGLVSMSAGGAAIGFMASAAIVLLATLRPARAMLRTGERGPLEFGQALAVSCAYDLGRAFALVARSNHLARRSGEAS